MVMHVLCVVVVKSGEDISMLQPHQHPHKHPSSHTQMADAWGALDDVVMGGVSESQFVISPTGTVCGSVC